MQKVVLSILSVIVSIHFIRCSNKPQEKSETTKTKVDNSEPVQTEDYLVHWRGAGSRITPQFIITTSPWRIEWSFQPKQQLIYGLHANIFSIIVHSSYEDFYRELAANTTNASGYKSGVTIIKDKGQFYLEITSMEGIWDVKIYEDTQ